MSEEKKKRGRPSGTFSENPASKKLPMVRVRPEQLEAYRSAAKNSGEPFSVWARDVLDKAVQKTSKKNQVTVLG